MRTVETPIISNYDGRVVQINVTGVCNQSIKRVSSYQIKVPHNRMNQAMREIFSLGGKITGVNVFAHKSETTSTKGEVVTKAPVKQVSKSTTPKRTSSSKSTKPKRSRRKN